MTTYEIVSIIIATIGIIVSVVSIRVSYQTKKMCEKRIGVNINNNFGEAVGNVEGDVNVEK